MKTILAALAVVLLLSGVADAAEQQYKVRKGNNLTWIASQHKVGLDALLFQNEKYLQEKYDRVCGRLSDSFRHRSADKGSKGGGKYFCNDRFVRPYGNTLQPGWILKIPSASAPVSVQETVRQLPGTRVALVIDDTGSMTNKRKEVAGFYLAALHQQKTITGVYLYADGKVRRYEAGSVRDLARILQTQGSRENTLDALLQAAQGRPDAIVLVSDERGDDWGNWSLVKSLPPVTAHCMPAPDRLEGCQETLRRLAFETRGRYIQGLK